MSTTSLPAGRASRSSISRSVVSSRLVIVLAASPGLASPLPGGVERSSRAARIIAYPLSRRGRTVGGAWVCERDRIGDGAVELAAPQWSLDLAGQLAKRAA